MIRIEAPAKVNLSLHVEPPGSDGLHPIRSLVQTVDLVDILEMEESEADSVEILGTDLDPEDNLVTRALRIARQTLEFPSQAIRVTKRIPLGSGLGGGSSDAAAALIGAAAMAPGQTVSLAESAVALGSDVLLFLTGGTLFVSGTGDVVESRPALEGFALAVAVPPFPLSTPEVYGKWDAMRGPTGEEIPHRDLPPALRDGMPVRNDLTPAAIAFRPELGDFVADLRATWGVAVSMTGSGSACFGFFPDLGEADDAALAVEGIVEMARGVELRPVGAALIDEEA